MTVMQSVGIAARTSHRTSHHSFRRDAEIAIETLGTSANVSIATGSTMYFGAWLGWPEWLRDGTSLKCSGPLPKTMTVRDDLLIIANILDHQGEQKILGRVLYDVRQPVGPLASLALANAPDLGQALAVMARLTNVLRPYFQASLDIQGAITRFQVEQRLPASRLADMISLTILFVSCRLVASYIGELDDGMTLNCGPATEFIDTVDARFACRASDGEGAAYIELPSSWLPASNDLGDESLWTLALEQIAQAERQRSEPEVVGRLRRTIATALLNERRVPRLKEVTGPDLSERSLARALAASGTSFQKIVEEERRMRALALINDPSLQLHEIAAQVGFNDMSSFGRSFRLWFGAPPGRFRKGQ